MKRSKRRILFLTALICGLTSLSANATTWDFDGVVDQCDAFACDLIGIDTSEPIAGFIAADDAVSGPSSTFGAADIVDYAIAAQGIAFNPANSMIVSASLTTGEDGELTSGTVAYAAIVDGGVFGDIELTFVVDVTTGTWMIKTDFLGLGFVASGPGQWSLEADGDGLAAIQDNCTEVANPAQRDTDADGIGNFCDPDFDQNCIVNFPDLEVMAADFFAPGDLDTDLDGSGLTNFGDLGIMSGYFFASPGPSGIPNVCGPVTNEPEIASVLLITSNPQIPSDDSVPATISAFVKDTNDNFVAGANVQFSLSSGGLIVTQGTTDENGTATALLSTAGDPTNRIITVTATSEALGDTIDIGVAGTQLTVSGPSSLVLGDTATYTLVSADSAGSGISGETLTVSSATGNTLAATTLTTDPTGQAQVNMTATTGGVDALTATGLGLTATRMITVSDDALIFSTPVADAEITLGNVQVITVTWLQNGTPQVGESIGFSTTRGEFVVPAPPAPPIVTTNGAGQASVSIRSNNLGPAIVSAIAVGGPTTRLPVEFIATIPASIEVQADPFTVAPNNQATITAVVRDADDNRVKNARIIFSLSDFSGGTLTVGSADTDNLGRAQTFYSANDVPTGDLDAQITAFVESNPTINDTVAIAVASPELFVAIGTSNELVEPNTATYEWPFQVIVTDSEGNGVPDTNFQVQARSLRYNKGRWLEGAEMWFTDVRATCDDEDLNGNGILDSDEVDVNTNGTIEAGNVVQVIGGDALTDAEGKVTVTLRYAQLYGFWTEIKLRAQLSMAGEEFSDEVTFVLPMTAEDLSLDNAPPALLKPPDENEFGIGSGPFLSSPWGYAASCAQDY